MSEWEQRIDVEAPENASGCIIFIEKRKEQISQEKQ